MFFKKYFLHERRTREIISLDKQIVKRLNGKDINALCIKRRCNTPPAAKEVFQLMWGLSPTLNSTSTAIHAGLFMSAVCTSYGIKHRCFLGREYAPPGRAAKYYSWIEQQGEVISTGRNMSVEFEPLFELIWKEAAEAEVTAKKKEHFYPTWKAVFK